LTEAPNAALREYQRKSHLKIKNPNFTAQDRRYFVKTIQNDDSLCKRGYPDFSASKILTIEPMDYFESL